MKTKPLPKILLFVVTLLLTPSLMAQANPFKSAHYTPAPLPTFERTRGKLPAPIYDEAPLFVQAYWKAWELAFRNFHEPTAENGFVSQLIDASFSQNIFLWDTCFMTMFTNYAHPLVPGIGSLDNFYAKQHDDGEISREIDRKTGRDSPYWISASGRDLYSHDGNKWQGQGFSVAYIGRDVPKPPPVLTLDALNHPIAAWAELESYRITGDRQRLEKVYGPLVKYYRALDKYLRQGNGLYITDWAGMDNSPRNDDIVGGGTAVDISAEMVMFARQLAQIAELMGKPQDASALRHDADQVSATINAKMWNPQRGFYFDLSLNGKQSSVKTVGAYWTLLAGVASDAQAQALATELRNPATFGRQHRVPTLAADERGFNPMGGYWRGSVWAPTTTMVIRGLQKYGQQALATEIAMEHLRAVSDVFAKTNTIWENYAPDSTRQGDEAKADFVGWSGLGPIMYLIEFAIGIQADAPANTIVWDIQSSRRVGVENFRFGGKLVQLVAEAATADGKRMVKVSSDQPLTLQVRWQGKKTTIEVKAAGALSLVL
jgi:hypothetical protein